MSSDNPVRKAFDYSKWDNIELSDDEEDVHPNIERESWFRMKHRSRVEREEREEVDKKRIRDEMATADLRIRELSLQLSQLGQEEEDDDDDEDLEDVEGLQAELKELQTANEARQDKLDSYEKHKKWNVDNMCHVVEERTIVNKQAGQANFTSSGYALPTTTGEEEDAQKEEEEEDAQKEETKRAATTSTATSTSSKSTTTTSSKPAPAAAESSSTASSSTSRKPPPALKKLPQVGPDRRHVVSMMSYHEFTEAYAPVVEAFMALESMEASRDFLLQHGTVLLQENASNYLLLASLEDEMNGYREKMKLTARQSQIISNMAELAKSLQTHPGNVVMPFFQRLQQEEFREGFLQGVQAFCDKIIARAVVKKKEMDAERAASVDLQSIPREERLGPGGLDPVEVFESLPTSVQEAFEARDTELLKRALLELDPAEAERHMKRCVDSGLWNEG